jgi:hypothetical protein
MSDKAIARWSGKHHPTPVTVREQHLAAKLKPLSADAAAELDEICSQHIDDAESRTLFVAGTLLLRHGHRRVWKQLYRACVGNKVVINKGDELRFLEYMTAAARWGQI